MRALLVFLLPLAYAGILRPKPGYEQFIISGDDTTIDKYPWQLSLRTTGHICGASIVRSTSAVTAAHCVDSTGPYHVRGGVTNRNDLNGFDRTVTVVTIHAGFNKDGNVGFPNDVATMKWNLPVSTSSTVSFATLAPSGTGGVAFKEAECHITGWGKTVGCALSCPATPSILQMAVTQIITRAECTVGTNTWSTAQINDGHVCLHNGVSSACQGDSGGPLVCRHNVNDAWTLVGATSWGQSMCNVAFPSVYTSVAFFRSWIDANL